MVRARTAPGVLLVLAMLVVTVAAVPAAPSSAAGSCTGFSNRTGVTATAITLANVSDLSGPVPGLGRPALDGVKAYARYFNSTSSICGRKLKVLSLDSKTDSAAGATAYATACAKSIAAVGSWSSFDDGGASTAQKCGLLDLRSVSNTNQRNACTTCFGVRGTQARAFPNLIPDYFVTNHPTASQASAFVYLNTGSYAEHAAYTVKDEQARGMKFIYNQGIDVASFNYGPYVSQMKNLGVQLVQFSGPSQQAVRLATAMHDAGFTPVFQTDPTTYFNKGFVSTGGAAVNGTYVPVDITPFAEQASNTELRRYLIWLQKVDPGATPSIDGLFAWSAARLFVDRARALGGHLSRVNLVSAVRAVHQWTDLGAHANQNVGSKVLGTCWRMLRLSGGKWAPVGGTSYSCRGKTVAAP